MKIIGTIGVIPVPCLFFAAVNPERNRDFAPTLPVFFVLMAGTDVYLINTQSFPSREYINVAFDREHNHPWRSVPYEARPAAGPLIARGRQMLYFKMKRTLTILEISGLLIIVLGLNACAPIPNYAFISPAVIGKVHRNGKPIENAVVYIEYPRDENCSFKSDVAARTNSNGEFRFEPRREFQFFVAMDPVHNWQVCIADGNSRYQGWYQHGIGRLAGIGQPAPEVTLDCNLEHKPHVQKDSPGSKIMGGCRSSGKYNRPL